MDRNPLIHGFTGYISAIKAPMPQPDFLPQTCFHQELLPEDRKLQLKLPDIRDIPVEKSYLTEISALGLTLHSTSKWMNTALFKSVSAFDIQQLLDLPFVTDVRIVKTPGKKSLNNKLDFELSQDDLPPYDRPVTMVNGAGLHSAGFTGKDIFIAVLDGGFINADRISSLNGLRSRNGIRGTHDFVNNTGTVYNTQ